MTKFANGWHQDKFGLQLNLVLGPHEGDGDWTEAQLRRGWTAYRSAIMERPTNATRPDRPWGWWHFQLKEKMPESYADRVLRLLELDELSDEEVAMVGQVAHSSLKHIEWSKHVREAGASSSEVDRMFARRAEDASKWHRVLAGA